MSTYLKNGLTFFEANCKLYKKTRLTFKAQKEQ